MTDTPKLRAVQEYLNRVLSHVTMVYDEIELSRWPTFPLSHQAVEINCKALLWLLGPTIPTDASSQDAMAGYGVEPTVLIGFFATHGKDSGIMRAVQGIMGLSERLIRGGTARPSASIVDRWHDTIDLLTDLQRQIAKAVIE